MRISHHLTSVVAILVISSSAAAQTTRPADLEKENLELRQQLHDLRVENTRLHLQITALLQQRQLRTRVIPAPEPESRREDWIPRPFNGGTFYLIPLEEQPKRLKEPE